VIHTLLMLASWTVATPFIAIIAIPWTLLSGKIDFLYRISMRTAWIGVRLAGVKVEIIGLELLDPAQSYIFMSNHASNLDPPILLPLIPRRTSVLVKKELFRIPFLGYAMRLGSLVPVDRSHRDTALASLHAAAAVLKLGINLTIFVEGTRSSDGRLLPFKKGPFHLAMESGVPVVPVTIVGTHEIMPKRRFGIRPGNATVVFHPPIDSRQFTDRDALLTTVRQTIASPLPEACR
jgi:1-acyl-sn-glycerol-3-phosphate acyltransferase